jgi:hypothetical protein
VRATSWRAAVVSWFQLQSSAVNQALYIPFRTRSEIVGKVRCNVVSHAGHVQFLQDGGYQDMRANGSGVVCSKADVAAAV